LNNFLHLNAIPDVIFLHNLYVITIDPHHLRSMRISSTFLYLLPCQPNTTPAPPIAHARAVSQLSIKLSHCRILISNMHQTKKQRVVISKQRLVILVCILQVLVIWMKLSAIQGSRAISISLMLLIILPTRQSATIFTWYHRWYYKAH